MENSRKKMEGKRMLFTKSRARIANSVTLVKLRNGMTKENLNIEDASETKMKIMVFSDI